MAILPTPTGQSPFPNLTSPAQTTRTQAVNNYVQLLTSNFGSGVGDSYRMYAASHPGTDAYSALQTWANLQAAGYGPALSNQISQVISSAAGLDQKTANALPALDVFKGLNLGNLMLRVGETVLGVVLVGVGLAKLTGAENAISKVATKGLL